MTAATLRMPLSRTLSILSNASQTLWNSPDQVRRNRQIRSDF